MITRASIDRLLQTVRIEEVVGDYVRLKKKGASYTGLCPFHNEKTPSFIVTPARGIFKCFGCGEGGDSVGFLMKHDKLSYPEALKTLAAKYRIELEETKTEVTTEELEHQSLRDSLMVVNSFAQRFFQDNLHHGEEGQAIGLSYFRERGVLPAMLEKFGLGYAPKGRKALIEAAKEAGHSIDHLVQLGLAMKSDERPAIDYFHGRVVFPFYNLSGKVVGFGARTLSSDKNEPKYLNSKESELYHKSEILFGLFQARKAIRQTDEALLAEGYLDVISLHQAGCEHAVASSGTSLTEEQARILHRLTRRILIVYDGDNAGIKATLRAFEILLTEGFEVSAVLLPTGEDPDSFSRKPEIDITVYLKENRLDIIRYFLAVHPALITLDPLGKMNLMRELIRLVSLAPDPLMRAFYGQEVARMFHAEEGLVLDELNKERRKITARGLGREEPAETVQTPAIAPRQEQQEIHKDPEETSELDLIRLLLNYPHLPYNEVTSVEQYVLANFREVDWKNPQVLQLMEHFYRQIDQSPVVRIEELLQAESQDLRNFIIDMLSQLHSLSPNWLKKHEIAILQPEELVPTTLDKTIQWLTLRKVERLIRENQEELKQLDDEQAIMEILAAQRILEDEKRRLSKILGGVILQYTTGKKSS